MPGGFQKYTPRDLRRALANIQQFAPQYVNSHGAVVQRLLQGLQQGKRDSYLAIELEQQEAAILNWALEELGF